MNSLTSMRSGLNSNLRQPDDSLMSGENNTERMLNEALPKGSINSQFGFHTSDMIEQRLLPGNVSIPFCPQKYVSGVDMFKIKFKDCRIGWNIFKLLLPIRKCYGKQCAFGFGHVVPQQFFDNGTTGVDTTQHI